MRAAGALERPGRGDGGFTIVEVIVAIMVLSIGVLGLAGTAGLLVRQVTLAELTTQRTAAFQSVVERLRSLEWESVGNGSTTIGSYAVQWWIQEDHAQSRVMKIVTVGPGLSTEGGLMTLRPSVADTFTYRILRY